MNDFEERIEKAKKINEYLDTMGMDERKEEYVKKRRDMIYYKYVRTLMTMCSFYAGSILDIGSGGVDVISHCVNVKRKVSIDRNWCVQHESVEEIYEDFLEWNPEEKFDIICCFQVLEHIEDVKAFCDKMLELSAGMLIVSVPFQWTIGLCEEHIQDPVDLNKLAGWFGFAPSFVNVVEERLIAVFIKEERSRKELAESNEGEFTDFYREYTIACKENRYRVPYDCLGEYRKIVLYGAGDVGKAFYRELGVQNKYKVVKWVDRAYENYRRQGYEVDSPESINEVEYDAILIAICSEDVAGEIREYLEMLTGESLKIVWGKPV